MDYILPLIERFMTGVYDANDEFLEDLSRFSELEGKIHSLSNELAAGILSGILTSAGKLIEKSHRRKQGYNVQRHDSRTLISTVGDVTFEDIYYRNKETGKYVYLLDKLLHLPAHERLTTLAEAKLVSEATVYSYQHAADQLAIGDQKVSKVTVQNKVWETKANLIVEEEPEPVHKRQTEYLYIEADEDHIHRQKNGREDGCMIGKLIYLFEGKEDVCEGRRRLIKPHYFGGLYPGEMNASLWDEVERFIEKHYDTDVLKRVYISSDGGSWIKAAKDHIDRSVLVADRFHLMKYINRVCRLTDDENLNKGRFYKYIWKKDQTSVRKLLTRIENTYGQARQIDEARTFFENNWKEVIRAFHDKHVFGCSAEGHVSNVFSDRMSSRPMGWSEIGSDSMCKLRCYVRNYGRDKVVDLVAWRREKEFERQSLQATGTDGLIEPEQKKRYSLEQRRDFVYIEKLQATLSDKRQVKKALAIREQIGNI